VEGRIKGGIRLRFLIYYNMNLVNNYMICDKCKKEFDRVNFPVTIPCGHNLCKECVSGIRPLDYFCHADKVKQDIDNSPSVEYLNFIEAVKTIPELYKPIKFENSFNNKRIQQNTFNQNIMKNAKVCKFFLHGNCRFGDKCWNLHRQF
jgi:hypothetical protein